MNSTHNNQATSSISGKSKNKLLAALGGILLIIFGAFMGYVWQGREITALQKEVTSLKSTQLPQQKFSSFEDCTNNGGTILITINVQFNGCLGGNLDEVGDLPQHQAFMQYSAQNLPRLGEKIRVSGDPDNLKDFINSSEGCEAELIKEVKDRFALVKCTDQRGVYDVAIKLSDGWRYISTTNNMNEKGQPSCLVVDMFKVSKELTPKCYENTGYNNDSLKDVTYL